MERNRNVRRLPDRLTQSIDDSITRKLTAAILVSRDLSAITEMKKNPSLKVCDNWCHEINAVKMQSEDKYQLPPESDKGWIKNNSKFWPRPTYEDLVDYLIHSKAYDGKEMKAFRAMYGYNYVQNGWMGDIWSNDQDNVTYVKSKISPSQPGVGRKDYETWIAIADKTDIKTGHCTCPAGNARSCSHISAIIYALSLAWKNGVSGETCTDKEQVWGKGAAHVLTHEPLSDMNFKRPSQTTLAATKAKKTEMVSDVTMETKQFLDHQDLEEFVDQSPMKIMWGTSGTMLHKILTAPVTQEKKAKEIPHQDHVVDSQIPVKIPLSCAKCQNFYEKFVLFEENKRKFIEDQTKLQNSDLWTDSRKLRITSSRVSNIPKTKRANPEKYVTNQIYPRFKGCAATQYGQKFEPIARQWFESNYDTQVRLTGLVISEEEPYIAASPDGVIDENTILEIKCPTKPLSTLIQSGKYDVINLNGENVLSPKGKNGYFCQVQFAMFCTKSTLCKFVLWTPDQQILINVPFDRPYVEAILPRLREFYFNQLLVRLTEEFNANRLKLSAEYKLCCQ